MPAYIISLGNKYTIGITFNMKYHSLISIFLILGCGTQEGKTQMDIYLISLPNFTVQQQDIFLNLG